MENRRLDALQGLRALAALLVVVSHSILSLVDKAALGADHQQFAWSSGAMGVRIFFAISGFVMVYTSCDIFFKSGASQKFFLKRLLRVAPLYYLTTLIYFGKLALQNMRPGAVDLSLSLLFIPYMNSKALLQPIYGLGWTLNYEMFFYFLFSLALFLRFRSGIAFLCFALLSLVQTGVYLPLIARSGFWLHWLTFVCDPIMIYFLIGVIIGCVRVRTRFYLSSWSVAATLLTCLLISLLTITGRFSERGLIVMMLITGSVTVGLAGLRAPVRDDGRLHSRVIRSLGDASYSIYLTHSFLVGPAARVWGLMFRSFNYAWPLFVAIMLLCCSILGVLTYHFVEKPVMNFVRERTSGRQAFALRPIYRATLP